jgi:hypothetical protein
LVPRVCVSRLAGGASVSSRWLDRIEHSRTIQAIPSPLFADHKIPELRPLVHATVALHLGCLTKAEEAPMDAAAVWIMASALVFACGMIAVGRVWR